MSEKSANRRRNATKNEAETERKIRRSSRNKGGSEFSWTCTACTYVNAKSQNVCYMCMAIKAADFSVNSTHKTVVSTTESPLKHAEQTTIIGKYGSLYKDITIGLMLGGIISFVPGAVLSYYQAEFLSLAGLTTLVPSLIGMRGNVFGSLSAKLSTTVQEIGRTDAHTLRYLPSTLYHPTPHRTDKISGNGANLSVISRDLHSRYDIALAEMILLSMLLPLLLVIFSIIQPNMSFGVSLESFRDMACVCVYSGLLSGFLMLYASRALVYTSYRHGYNPDNVAAPFVTSSGDMITLPLVLLAAEVMQRVVPLARTISLIAALVWALYLLIRAKSRLSLDAFLQTIKERLPVLLTCMCISFGAGIFLDGLLEELSNQTHSAQANALLISLAPVFNAQGGSGGGIFASRVSTFVSQEMLARKKRRAQTEDSSALPLLFPPSIFGEAITLSLCIATVLSSLTILMVLSPFGISLHRCVVLNGGMWLTLSLCSVIGYYTSKICSDLNWDPDNFGVPIVCASMDFLAAYAFWFLAGSTAAL